jgi:hypothetical protein
MRQRLFLIAVLLCTGCSATPTIERMPVRGEPVVWLDGQRLVIDEDRPLRYPAYVAGFPLPS